MEFRRKQVANRYSGLIKIFIKIAIFFAVASLLVVLIDRIKFPHPNKKIEKIIPNESFKVLK
tara:strand:+ start:340 stop:525 length:186 start_codon:yes stop_codon:yes gene_type:complete